MHIGAIFPTLEIGNDPIAIRDYAQAVEEIGFQHLVLLDHVLGFDRTDLVSAFGPLTHSTPFHEPLVLMGFLAACTQWVELVTGVLVLPMRQTAVVAKQAAEVDVLSRGRLRLGIGVGWRALEFAALDQDYATRGARSAEQIEVLRALWTGQAVTFQGRWHYFDAAGMAPVPVQKSIPIWLGGGHEQTFNRIARLGDGWMPIGPPNERRQTQLAQLRAHTAAAGRPSEAVGVHAFPLMARASEADWLADIKGWRKLGANYLSVDTMRIGLTKPQEHIESLRTIRQVMEQEGEW